ncbi:hypothetical protein OH460_09255 [Vibrio sp. Makdt]|uniref:hypothetical protein n=1 Tax=Vibrio sp. Makdt TaxID=2998828 RepID=UPI0022CD29BC|nr:hypothetical protein [Vibrio sp. Makdt]MDA0152490.1 hypothetical protein [Vibrio sp. Makdt]
MNMVNVDSYASAVQYMESVLGAINEETSFMDEVFPQDAEVQKFFFRCPLFLAFLINSFHAENPYKGSKSFDQFDLVKEAMRGTEYYISSIVERASSRNRYEVESIASFCHLSHLSFEEIDLTVKAFGLERSELISLDRLYLAATSLLIRTHFPASTLPLIMPLKVMTHDILEMKITPSLSIKSLVSDLSTETVSQLYPDSMEQKILAKAAKNVADQVGINPFG